MIGAANGKGRSCGAPVATGTAKRILIVEDDADTRLALEVRLEASDYVVTSVGEADRGVALIQTIRPDLVILDLGLPGIDGIELLDRLRLAAPAHRPEVIVISAWDEEQYEAQAIDSGAALYLEKPVADFELLAAIKHVLERK